MDIFAERIKELRNSNKKPQADLAKYLGITPRAIRFYENGERTPDFDNLIKIAEYFDVSIDYLTGRVDNPKQHLL